MFLFIYSKRPVLAGETLVSAFHKTKRNIFSNKEKTVIIIQDFILLIKKNCLPQRANNL